MTNEQKEKIKMPAHKNNKYAQKGEEVMTTFLHCRIMPSLKNRCVKSLNDNEKLCEFVMKALEKELDEREEYIAYLSDKGLKIEDFK